MNTKELAELLDGNKYRGEGIKKHSELAKDNNLVIVYNLTNDFIVFKGAISSMRHISLKATYIVEKEILENCCEHICCPYYTKLIKNARRVVHIWNEIEEFWEYKTDIKHETFNIYDHNKKYCEGIVFSLDDAC